MNERMMSSWRLLFMNAKSLIFPIRQQVTKLSLHEIVFACLLVVWIANSVCSTSMLGYSMHHGNLFNFFLIELLIINDIAAYHENYARMVFELRHGLLLVCLGVLVVLSLLAKQYWLLQATCIAYCARGIGAENLFKIWLFGTCLAVISVLAICAIGLIPDYVVKRTDGFARHSFGFTWPTFLSHYFLAIATSVLYLKRNSLSPFLLIVLIAFDFAIYLTTDSRSAFLLTLLVIVVSVVCQMRKKAIRPRRSTLFILRNSFFICALLSIAIIFLVDPSTPLGASINEVLSGRISLTQEALRTYPVSITGGEIHWSTAHLMQDGTVSTGYYDSNRNFVAAPYLYVDNSYMNMLFSSGLVVFCIALLLLTVLTHWLVRKELYFMALILLVFAIRAIIDPQLLMLHYSPYLLLLLKPWRIVPQSQGDGGFSAMAYRLVQEV